VAPQPSGASEQQELSKRGRLRLLVRHRTGSLDAAAAAAYRGSQVISFCALALLAAGMVQLVIANGRARSLARRQLEFVAGVSHELRTPLAILRSAGENLADGVAGNGDQQTREYGSLISAEARRLTGMVEHLLEYAGMRSGRKRYAREPVDVMAVANQAISGCLPLVREAGMELKKSVPDALPQVLGDAAALRSAIENLISNAVKYAASGQWVRLEVRVDGREVEICVVDGGPGVPAADRRRIFEPFERGRGGLNSKIRGAGIGLTLVKHIAEAHGGCVSLRSSPGRGSRFTLHLPLTPESDSGEKS
jgi:signal transduction histidine kinase